MTYGAPHHLVSDVPVTSVRRTRAGDAWEQRTSAPTQPAGVSLGMPSIGVPDPPAACCCRRSPRLLPAHDCLPTGPAEVGQDGRMSRAAGSDESWRGTSRTPFWLDHPDRPPQRGSLDRHVRADLAVVGGGYTGLWTALLAKERDPDRDVVLLEAASIGWAASGRNGGFCAASLTHGAANGLERFADEYRHAGATRPGEPGRPGRRRRAARDRLRPRGHRRAVRRDRGLPGRRSPRGGRAGRTVGSSTATRCGPRSPHRRTARACGTPTAA